MKQMPHHHQRRKSSNISNVNATDDLQLAISKMLPNIVDMKPQVRIQYVISFEQIHLNNPPPHLPQSEISNSHLYALCKLIGYIQN